MSQRSPSTVEVVSDVSELRQRLAHARRQGLSLGLAPTMGALHRGHLSLVEASKRAGDFTVVSVFVNPTQFGPGEDFSRYPRTSEQDVKLLAEVGADLVFAPPAADIYRPGHATTVHVSGVTEPLEGQFRPSHFDGVATIVLKLFHLIPADRAYFGQKDYQQSLLIRRMVADLDLPTEIVVCPIVRDADGLALSSRNAYLSPDERRRALALPQSLQLARTLVADGTTDAAAIVDSMRERLLAADVKLDYVAVADPETLLPIDKIRVKCVALIAGSVGSTRLIDNEILGVTLGDA